MADVQHGNGTITKLLYDDPLDKQLQAPLKQLNAVMASANGTSAKLKEFQDGLDWRHRRISQRCRRTQERQGLVRQARPTAGAV